MLNLVYEYNSTLMLYSFLTTLVCVSILKLFDEHDGLINTIVKQPTVKESDYKDSWSYVMAQIRQRNPQEIILTPLGKCIWATSIIALILFIASLVISIFSYMQEKEEQEAAAALAKIERNKARIAEIQANNEKAHKLCLNLYSANGDSKKEIGDQILAHSKSFNRGYKSGSCLADAIAARYPLPTDTVKNNPVYYVTLSPHNIKSTQKGSFNASGIAFVGVSVSGEHASQTQTEVLKDFPSVGKPFKNNDEEYIVRLLDGRILFLNHKPSYKLN